MTDRPSDPRAAGASASDEELAQRLRGLADALTAGRLPAAARKRLAGDLARWERELAAGEPALAPAGSAAASAGSNPAPAPSTSAAASNGMIRIWGDGSCAPNPGPGGWGAIIERDGRREELSGSAPASTNNIMELTAVIEPLRRTPRGSQVHIVTDSQYVKNGITAWIHAWKRKGWRKADGKAVLNQELWRTLDALCGERRVSWAWVRGHSGHDENERCDELASRARREQPRP